MAWIELQTARVLIIDDDEDNLIFVKRALTKAGCKDVITESDPFAAAEVCKRSRPDLILLDMRLPPVDGFYVLEELKKLGPEETLPPIIMLTGDASEEVKQRALEAGVADFVRREFDLTELVLRTRNSLRIRQLFQQVQRNKEELEEMVMERTRDLRRSQRETLERLALAAEFRDDQTSQHTQRVGELSALIADAMGAHTGFVEDIRSAALLHDLGKIGIPDAILNKPGPLTPTEYDILKEHTEIGCRILDGCTERVLQLAQQVALSHHEAYDGSGYPRGLKGEDIPLAGRIVAAADAFDAIMSERPYKPPRPISVAIQELESEKGKQFDPAVVDALLEVVEKKHVSSTTYAVVPTHVF
ncbi:MAG: cyclic di-GMP phosphodiesterase [Fimbriimonadaceae bacterium]|nr:cyclic di-GMP phosphodiesterase [Fimbriimonadaceae bacterium]